MPKIKIQGLDIYYEQAGGTANPCFIWAHGWGQNHLALKPLAQSFIQSGTHYFIDLPGFGQSEKPEGIWGSAEYADCLAEFIQRKNIAPVIWTGHSYGGRVGVQLAARHPQILNTLCLIAASGLPRKRKAWETFKLKARVFIYKFCKKLIPLGLNEDWLKSKFGSADYKNAGAMRPVLLKAVSEDLSEIAPKVSTPVLLLYGAQDTETPPEIGERYNKMIENSQMIQLSGQDHYSVLGEGRHIVARHLKHFFENGSRKI